MQSGICALHAGRENEANPPLEENVGNYRLKTNEDGLMIEVLKGPWHSHSKGTGTNTNGR